LSERFPKQHRSLFQSRVPTKRHVIFVPLTTELVVAKRGVESSNEEKRIPVICAGILHIMGSLCRATIFVEPQQGFETYIAAAFTKEGVRVDLVTDEARAKYILKSVKLEITSQVRDGKTAQWPSLLLQGDSTGGQCFRSADRGRFNQNSVGLLRQQSEREQVAGVHGGIRC
jgi:hypothetical protein